MSGEQLSPGRVRLRRATPADAASLVEWRREPSASRYQPLRRRTEAELRDSLVNETRQRLDRALQGQVRWIIESPDGAVGWISLDVISQEHRIADVGYTIAERERGKGYATAALPELVRLAFSRDGLDLQRLQAVTTVDNVASRRVLERVGFQDEGVARGYLIVNGARVDHARYGLLRDDEFVG